MWAMCKFLEDDAQRLNRGSVSDGFCCSSGRFRMWCNAPTVTSHDIMLIYDPPLLYSDVTAWLSGDSANNYEWHLSDAVGARSKCDTLSLNGSEARGSQKNKILNADMPPSVSPRAVHVFGPAAATWHVRPECYQMIPGRWGGEQQAECEGAAKYVGGDHDQRAAEDGHEGVAGREGRNVSTAALVEAESDAAACEVTAAFCARFVNAAASIRQATLLPAHTTALYVVARLLTFVLQHSSLSAHTVVTPRCP